MATATFEYKCRRCGKLHGGSQVGSEYADTTLSAALFDRSYPTASPILKTVIGHCDDGGGGIADLVGYRVED